MPNTKSAKKRLRQSEVRRQRNKSVKSSLRSQIRRVREAVAAGEIETAEQEFVQAARKLDRAGGRYIIHRNTASRIKSRLQKLIRKAKQPAATA
jgi:small subunit ribosomal protein S20